MVNGSDGGAAVTFNGGRTWSSLDNQPTAQFYAVDHRQQRPVPDLRIAAGQHDRLDREPHRAAPASPRPTGTPVGGGESGYLAPTPSNPPVVFGGSYFGPDDALRRTAPARAATSRCGPTTTAAARRRRSSTAFSGRIPIIVSPHDGNTRVRRRAGVVPVDQRRTELGGDQPGPHAQRQGEAERRPARRVLLDDLHHRRIAAGERASSGRDPTTGWCSVTRNGGRDWQNVTPPALQPFTRVNIIEASPHDAGDRVRRGEPVSARRLPALHLQDHRLRQSRGRRSRPAFPSAASSGRCARIRARKGLLFAGTETGVYYSLDDGARWQSLQLNLPVVPITDLTIKNDDLVAATQGRAFWVLDDITPLHDDERRGDDGRPRTCSRRVTRFARGGPASAAAPPASGQNPPARRDRDLLA